MIKLYFEYFNIQIKSLLEYKKAFIFSLIGQIFSSSFSILAIYFLFDKFHCKRVKMNVRMHLVFQKMNRN